MHRDSLDWRTIRFSLFSIRQIHSPRRPRAANPANSMVFLARFGLSVVWRTNGTLFCSPPMNTGARANAIEVLSANARFARTLSGKRFCRTCFSPTSGIRSGVCDGSDALLIFDRVLLPSGDLTQLDAQATRNQPMDFRHLFQISAMSSEQVTLQTSAK